jgi:fatty acid desaturase
MNARTQISDLFSREEIRQLTQSSNLKGFQAVGLTWTVIGLTFGTVAVLWPYLNGFGKVVTCLLALVILAGRQLTLGILTHDAAHRSLFKTPWLNDVLADWLCARPVWNNVHLYRPYHLLHHAKTSTADDPDLSLVAGLPTTPRSLMRKFARDIFGITGIKFVIGRILMDLGLMRWTVANDVQWLPQQGRSWWDYPLAFIKNSGAAMIVNAVLLAILWASSYPALYLLWVLAYITPFPLLLRIRSMAEHAGTESSLDVLKNTRTTQAGWIARALFAPIHVNYHIEHHLMASVPYFKLPVMHKMLRERGYVGKPPTYFEVFKLMASKNHGQPKS